jgi:la-related protein 1
MGKRVGGGFAIGLAPDEVERTRVVKAARRRSAPPAMALSPEIVDLTDGAWLRDMMGSRGGEERGTRERKWEFGTSRYPPDSVSSSSSSSSPLPQQPLQPFLPPQMYTPPPPPPHSGMYVPPSGPPMSVSAPESVVGDPTEYDVRNYAYGEPYGPGIERERRGGYAGPARRGRFAGGRGGPNGNAGRGFGGRRGGGGGPSQHYGTPPPPPGPYTPSTAYPPPPPPPGPDGYYMGPPYSLPYPQYVPPPIPPYPAPPVMDAPAAMRPAPLPMPLTLPNFPIDPTRWYLLGQLEYYFSVQNLCTDFWLRKQVRFRVPYSVRREVSDMTFYLQMDDRGWVPISVIASFNRVRHLTSDATLVRDVLALSAYVEVYGEKVRLRDRHWEPFVLPDAPASDVLEPMEQQQLLSQPQHHPQEAGDRTVQPQEEGAEEEGEEEDDVVFVMGEERRTAAAQWAPREGAEQRPQS